MQHTLDNPIWHALVGPHADLAVGHGLARHYPRDLAPFSSVGEPTEAAYADLDVDLPHGLEARLFRPNNDPAPRGWEAVSTRPIVQMVARKLAAFPATSETECLVLGSDDGADMLTLAEVAKPGPFGPRTSSLGVYLGVRRAGQLIAMGGERFRLPGFVELSGICVHPSARGTGLGAAITANLMRMVLERGETPFLHVFPDNPAVALYARLGFLERARLFVLWHRRLDGRRQ